MKRKRGGIIFYLCRQNKGTVDEEEPLEGFESTTYSMASNSGEETDSLNHSATGITVCISNERTNRVL